MHLFDVNSADSGKLAFACRKLSGEMHLSDSHSENQKKIQLQKPTVLAVDDHESNLIALHAVLGSEYKIINALSGREAVSLVKSNPHVDVILMDIQMPDMDGFETASEIKRIPEASDIPIIFITAIYKEEPFIKRGYALGGVDYFSKPFDPEILKLKLGVYSSFRRRSAILKQREQQIRETEDLLRVGRKLSAVLESLPVGVLISDVQGRVCQINEQVSQICDQNHHADPNVYGEMLGWWDREGKMLSHSGPLTRVLTGGKQSQSEIITLNCKSGKQKRVLCSASPLLGLDRHIVGAVVVLQDITESKEIEADLQDRITRVVSVGIELEESTKH
jgi:CheY-like chemotaxis protein